MDELDSFINRAMSEGVLDAGSSGPAGMDEPVEQAQELAFQAMEEPDDRKALELTRRALKLDPECIDARSVELQITVDDPQERAKAFQLMLKQARKAMGKEFFEENKGQFWGVVTTRPYMRALDYLADLLVPLERFGEAIAVYEEMIELNPEDNQGVRDSLLGLYLGEGDVLRARSLLNRYHKDDMAVFSWGRAIERFLSGDRRRGRRSRSGQSQCLCPRYHGGDRGHARRLRRRLFARRYQRGLVLSHGTRTCVGKAARCPALDCIRDAPADRILRYYTGRGSSLPRS